MSLPDVSELAIRVNYSEVDQMGVVYHARYLVWLDMARTEHLRARGSSYRDVELRGFRLAVGEVTVRYRTPARYDDLLRVRCWVSDLASRRVTFDYAIEHVAESRLVATASTAMIVLNAAMSPTRLPDDIRAALAPASDRANS